MELPREELLSAILDAHPYPIVFVDCEHIIRYMNRAARYHYHEERGYPPLLGKSLFECHTEKSAEMVRAVVEKLRCHGNEVFLKVNVRNQRLYITPVRNAQGELIGYFERFEMNLQK